MSDSTASSDRILHVSYVCRPFGPIYHGLRGLEILECHHCGCKIVAQPTGLRKAQKMAEQNGRPFKTLCDDCADPIMAEPNSQIHQPSEAESMDAQNRIEHAEDIRTLEEILSGGHFE